jgi:MSHA biogenesis protein MshJ
VKHLLRRWWAARQPRERSLAIAVAGLAIAALVETAVLGPQRDVSTRLARESDQAQQRLQQLQALAARQAGAGEEQVRHRRAALQERRARALRVIEQAQVDLIPPQEMSGQLEAILARHTRLRVVGLNSTGPKPVVDGGSGAAPGLFQHGLELQIEGPYLDLLAYLEALERAPHRIYWRELELRTGVDGTPVTRLVFFTLSREATWLRL